MCKSGFFGGLTDVDHILSLSNEWEGHCEGSPGAHSDQTSRSEVKAELKENEDSVKGVLDSPEDISAYHCPILGIFTYLVFLLSPYGDSHADLSEYASAHDDDRPD